MLGEGQPYTENNTSRPQGFSGVANSPWNDFRGYDNGYAATNQAQAQAQVQQSRYAQAQAQMEQLAASRTRFTSRGDLSDPRGAMASANTNGSFLNSDPYGQSNTNLSQSETPRRARQLPPQRNAPPSDWGPDQTGRAFRAARAAARAAREEEEQRSGGKRL